MLETTMREEPRRMFEFLSIVFVVLNYSIATIALKPFHA